MLSDRSASEDVEAVENQAIALIVATGCSCVRFARRTEPAGWRRQSLAGSAQWISPPSHRNVAWISVL